MLEELKLFNLLPHQIEELIKELSLLLNQQEKSSNVIYEIVKDEKYLVCCPNCSSCNVVKNGHTKKGIQTYKCNDCKRRFNLLSTVLQQHSYCLAKADLFTFSPKFVNLSADISFLILISTPSYYEII